MNHIDSWELFLEKETVEDLEKNTSDKDLDQAAAKIAMEELLKQMDKDNPVIKIDQEKLKESFSKVYEEMATGAILDVLSDVGHHLHQIEQVVIGGAKQISHGDKVGSYLEKFFKSGGVKKVAKFCKMLAKAGHWVIGWFETVITWIARKLFGASATTATLASKGVLSLLIISSIITALILFPTYANSILVGGGFLLLIKGIGLAMLKFFGIAEKIYGLIKSIHKVEDVVSHEHIITITEFIDELENHKRLTMKFNARDIEELNHWYHDQSEENKEILSDMFKRITNKLDENIHKLKVIPLISKHFGLSKDTKTYKDLENWLIEKIKIYPSDIFKPLGDSKPQIKMNFLKKFSKEKKTSLS